MPGETRDVKQLFSNPPSPGFFVFLLNTACKWNSFFLGSSLSVPYRMQQTDTSKILLEISLTRPTSSFGTFSIFPQSMLTVLLFFSLLSNMGCCLFQPFLTVFLIVFPVSTCHSGPKLMPQVLCFGTIPLTCIHFQVLLSIGCATNYPKT